MGGEMMKLNYNKTNFQGVNQWKSQHYFEGWYYKQVSQDKKNTISFIPGVSFNDEDPHAFIQCIYKDKDNQHKTFYFKYTLDEFSYNNRPFEIRIGDSYFSKNEISIHLEDETSLIDGAINFGALTDLERTFLNPNIMGYFNYIPNLECNHEVVSMNHSLNGEITIDGEHIDFNHGKGYIEKDWGRSFPEKYIWIQSNHFDKDNISFCCSIASVPLIGRTIQGFFCNVIVDDQEYRFATYNNAKVKVVKCNKDQFYILMKRNTLTLKIKGTLTPGEELVAPNNGRMSYTIREALTGKLQLIIKNNAGIVLLNTKADHCGVEIVNYDVD